MSQIDAERLRAEFVRLLTVDSEHHDRRRKDFNQAIFNAEQGFAVWTDSQWIIYGGCHKFTVAEARAHWGNDYSGDRATGEGWLFALNWLDNQPQIYA